MNFGTIWLGLGIGRKKTSARLNSQLERDGWRLLASLEHLSGATRARSEANCCASSRKNRPMAAGYGPWADLVLVFHCTARSLASYRQRRRRIGLQGSWICANGRTRLHPPFFNLARVTGIAHATLATRCVGWRLHGWRTHNFTDETMVQRLKHFVIPDRDDVARTFGEPLPKGLHLESTANCLSPVSALGTEPRKLT